MNDYKNTRQCILALSWRDIKFPTMGGAEIYTHEMLKRAVAAGIEIVHFAPACNGLLNEEYIDGVHYIRSGKLWNVIWKARKYYRSRKNDISYVIDQCNTFRFFTKYWVPQKKRIFLIFQLTREIWDINMPFPFNKIGKLLETPLLRMNKNDLTITESDSTKKDLVEVGFKEENVKIIPVGLSKDFLKQPIDITVQKEPNFIYVGRYSKYKGIDTAIEAIGRIKEQYPQAKLWVVGKKDLDYIQNTLVPLCQKWNLSIGDEETNDIVTWGFVDEQKKYQLQKDAKALIFPSIREGWGMIISEAGALGTPSITYDAPGMRDAVDNGRAGYMCEEKSVEGIVQCIIKILKDENEYKMMQQKAWEYANYLDFDKTGQMFIELVSSYK